MDRNEIIKELSFTAVRSGGAGGQHVNKVSSKVVLKFDINKSYQLSDKEKEQLISKLANKLNKDNKLILTCEESRSQYKNKEIVIKKFLRTIQEALIVKKKRKPTKPSKSSIEKRLEDKSRQSLKKNNRNKIRL